MSIPISGAASGMRSETTTKTTYVAHIRIECQDRVGMLRDVIMKTGDLGINIIYSNTYLKGRKFVNLLTNFS